MNQATFRPQGLIWKETRLVLPLIWLLVAASVILVSLWSLVQQPAMALEYAVKIIPVMLPILYGVGAGAILVGQERENRTLWWFVSLPISPRRVFWTKTIVALVGLAVVLGGCVAFVWLSGRVRELDLQLVLVLLSVWLTVTGIFTAWKIKNTITSLVALVAMTIVLISFLSVLASALSGVTSLPYTEWFLVVMIGAMTCLAYRAAMQTLSPAESAPEFTSNADAWREPWQSPLPLSPPRPRAQIAAPVFRSSLSSLVWQSVHHNLLALISLVALAVACLAAQFFKGQTIEWLLGVGLFSAWLGVFAFTGDGASNRLKFLADRGVSPSKVWLARHAVNLSLVALVALIYGAMSSWLVSNGSAVDTPYPSLAAAVFVLWTLYGASQWISQLFRIVPGAAVLGPVLGAALVYWLWFAGLELDAPLGLIVLCSCIPMLATWLSMRWFMDDTGRWRLGLFSLAPAAALVVLPIVPAISTVVTWPSMPASTQTRLMAEADAASFAVIQPQSMMMKGSAVRDEQSKAGNSLFESLTDQQALRLVRDFSFAPDARLQLGEGESDASKPLSVDLDFLNQSLAIASYQMLFFEANPNDEQAIEQLGEWIQTLAIMAKRFRASPRWLDQEAGDVVEMWLTATLSRESMKPLAGHEFAQSAREMLADSESRNRARRRAVLLSWHRMRTTHVHELGGFALGNFTSAFSATMQAYVQRRNADAIVDCAIRMIDADERGEPTLQIRRELHRLTTDPAIAFEDGPYSDRLRASLSTGMVVSASQTLHYPGNQWFAGWETDAKQLQTSP